MPINDSFFLNPAHLNIARERYFLKDENGQPIESDIEEVFRRETDFVYKNDTPENKEEAFRLRCEKKNLPAGRPLANAGTGISNLYNCFVLPIGDTREDISNMKARHFHIQANGGGVGCDYSVLRPAGAICKKTSGHSSGAIGFITDISYQSSNIQQGGQRSGANLGLLHDWHPDLYEFITYKSEHNHEILRRFSSILNEDEFAYWCWDNHYKWQMFNVSVALSNRFMEEAENAPEKPWILKWEDIEWPLWDFENTIGPSTGNEYIKKITVTAPNREIAEYKARHKIPWGNARGLKLVKEPYHLSASNYLNLIAKNAWEDGCPGVVFMDMVREYHNLEYHSGVSACNPCGEQPLPNDTSCNLISTVWPTINDDELEAVVRQSIRSADNVVDVSATGDKVIDFKTKLERRVGLGNTGVAEWLIQNKLAYSSEEGRTAVGDRLRKVRDCAYRASIDLAKEKGSFKVFNFKEYSKSAFFKTLPAKIQEDIEKYGIRNGTLLSQAPVGSTGTMIGYSTGCEPYFAMAYTRNSKVGVFQDGSPAFNKWLVENNIDYSKYNFSLSELKDHFTVPEYFEEAHDIHHNDHLLMQAEFAKYIDTGVSKTINLPKNANIGEIRNIFLRAFSLGIKSITVYRDGSKQQVLEKLKKEKTTTCITEAQAPERPKELPCDIHFVTAKGEKWIVMIGLLNERPFEVFCAVPSQFEISKKYKTGVIIKENKKSYSLDLGDFKIKDMGNYLDLDEHKMITRLLSTSLRYGVPIDFVSKQLKAVEGDVVSLSKAILRVLSKYESGDVSCDLVCEGCGSKNTRKTSSCYECLDCSWSRCS